MHYTDGRRSVASKLKLDNDCSRHTPHLSSQLEPICVKLHLMDKRVCLSVVFVVSVRLMEFDTVHRHTVVWLWVDQGTYN